MIRITHSYRVLLLSLLLVGLTAVTAPPTWAQDDATPRIPNEKKDAFDEVPLSPSVRKAVDDTLLEDEERTELRIFHGLFDELSDEAKDTPDAALARWELLHPSLRVDAEQTPVIVRARAAYRRGDLADVTTLLAKPDTAEARLLKGRAQHELGLYQQAVATLSPLRDTAIMRRNELTTAADLTHTAEAIAELAIIEGRSSRDYHTVINLLGSARQTNRLYWPAHLAEGELLAEKDNRNDAINALQEALALNPSSSRAWYLLGHAMLSGYNFDGVNAVLDKLREIHPQHVLADALKVESLLLQKDPYAALTLAEEALKRYPRHRQLRAGHVGAVALTHDSEAYRAALADFERHCGKHPLDLFIAGRYLSLARQYDAAEQTLKLAIRRHPNWVQPQLELGLLLNQAGKEEESRQVLRPVVQLDPFNKRAANVLKMLEDLAGYSTIETDHFIIKYRDPIDGALAADMPEELEGFYDEVTSAFDYEPKRKTLIEIMPNKEHFAVRITGMPDIWTIGAATGPVIALTPPREGRKQSGSFDWARVLRHEYVHTVTLEQTNNRIPHWFTEAAAVSQEPAPRDFQMSSLLAEAVAKDELFDLNEINWAFVRPKKPTDRAQAYAQAHWMFEYIVERFGHETILKMLELCRRGAPQPELVPLATGQAPDQFLAGFTSWAKKQVASWGMAPTPGTKEIVLKINEAGGGIEAVNKLLKVYPDHPDLLKWAAEDAAKGLDDDRTLRLLLRYATARPVDPWADRQIAKLAARLGKHELAISHLQQLDLFDQTTGEYATQLLSIFRSLDRLDDAQRAAHRALMRRPYDGTLREAAATVALQRGDNDTALRHIVALTLIEPDRAIHRVRLAAIHHRMGNTDKAHTAALEARKLDADAPVGPFLKK